MGMGGNKPILIVISAGWSDGFSEIVVGEDKPMAKESGRVWVKPVGFIGGWLIGFSQPETFGCKRVCDDGQKNEQGGRTYEV
ncbi:MAG: hypothetical protein A2162_11910 [Deltaproteobacteria bacterium RBG_13_52_11b]|nr:MAG: hypothetical protein A2162_11910 [Deltaproteobacteria bacterium RBG_13_52_11b]